MAKSQLAITILATVLVVSLALNAYQWGGSLTLTRQEQKQEMASLLIHSQAAINAKLQSLDAVLLAACQELSTTGLTGPQADRVLYDFYMNNSDLVVNAATSDAQDVLVAVQPSNYSNIIGEDIKNQEQNVEMHKTMRPALSNLIPLVEGFPGVVIVAPIFDSNEQFIGALSIVMQPYQLIHPIVAGPASSGYYTIYALQTNGTLIYDANSEEQGKNIFTDEAYHGYPELQTFIHQAVNTQSGYGTYSFFDDLRSSRPLISKEAYWTTIGIYNTAWRLVIAQPLNQ
jgi:hypothetical protein